jgi:P27 family predicted phage terminase small subunit
MARPRTPTNLKLVQGTARKDRLNPNEPKPNRSLPSAPEHLSDAAKLAWGKASLILDRMGVLTEADGIALEEVTETYAELVQCRMVLKSIERIYETDSEGGKMYRSHPIVAQIADASRRLAMWLTKFGMTPADRSRVTAAEADGEADPWASL